MRDRSHQNEVSTRSRRVRAGIVLAVAAGQASFCNAYQVSDNSPQSQLENIESIEEWAGSGQPTPVCLFVDDDAASGGDGLAWATAFDTLTAAGQAGSNVDCIRVA